MVLSGIVEGTSLSAGSALTKTRWSLPGRDLDKAFISAPKNFDGVMISIGSKQGELGRLVEENKCGFAIEEGDVDSLESAITVLFEDPDLCATMGHRARSMLDHHFTRRQAFDYWQTLISKVESGQPL